MKITLNEDQADSLYALANECGVIELRCNYSGRGMYGYECLGFIVGDIGNFLFLFGLGMGANQEQFGEIVAAFTDVRTDSMGRNAIIYFPNVQWCEEESAEDEE